MILIEKDAIGGYRSNSAVEMSETYSGRSVVLYILSYCCDARLDDQVVANSTKTELWCTACGNAGGFEVGWYEVDAEVRITPSLQVGRSLDTRHVAKFIQHWMLVGDKEVEVDVQW